MKHLIVVTGNLKLRSGWQEYVKAPTAPANYKDPQKIEEYIRKKTEQLEETVIKSCPLLVDVTGLRISVPKDAEPLWRMPDYGQSEGVEWLAIGRDASVLLRAAARDDRALYRALFHGHITTASPESLFATSEERNLLILEKLYPDLERHEIVRSWISELHGVKHWVEV